MRFDELVWRPRTSDDYSDAHTYVVREKELFALVNPEPPGCDPTLFFAYRCGRLEPPIRLDHTDLHLWLASATQPEEGVIYENHFAAAGWVVGVGYLNGETRRFWSRPIRPGPLTVKGVFPRG